MFMRLPPALLLLLPWGLLSAVAQPTPIVVISELMVNPAATADGEGEWIELFNPSAEAIDLRGWTLRDEGRDVHQLLDDDPILLPPGGYTVLGRLADRSKNGGVSIDYAYGSGFTLANSSDEVFLVDPAGREIDRLAYDDDVFPAGASLALKTPTLDNAAWENWCVSSTPYGEGDFGTPGAPNDCPLGIPDVLINEIDTVQRGPDTMEFVELYDGGSGRTPLDGLVLVLYEGVTGTAYTHGLDLDGIQTDERGFAVVCTDPARLPRCTRRLSSDERNVLHDGPAAIALYAGNAGDFPPGRPLTTEGLLDAVVYGGREELVTALLPLLAPGAHAVDEHADRDRNAHSLQRLPDGAGGPRVSEHITPLPPTPGVPNHRPLSPVVINEFVFDHAGVDVNEYIELFGAPLTDYGTLTLLLMEGDVGQGTGVIDALIVPGTTNEAGYWVSSFQANRFENGSQTLLLVLDFEGKKGDDLDTDDDGILDLAPWTRLLDGIAVRDGNPSDAAYAATVLTPGFDRSPGPPGGASRIPDGTNTGRASDWVRNTRVGAGLPDVPDEAGGRPGEALNTPGASNRVLLPPSISPGLMINEIDADTPRADSLEFIEIYDGGRGRTPLDHVVVVLFNGSNDLPYASFDLSGYRTNEEGYFVLGGPALHPLPDVIIRPGILQNGTDAVALYASGDGSLSGFSPLHTIGLQDALVYHTDDPPAPGLLPLLIRGSLAANEAEDGPAESRSLQRLPDGSGLPRSARAFRTGPPTPGTVNGGADLELAFLHSTDNRTQGADSITVTVQLRNDGPAPAHAIEGMLHCTFGVPRPLFPSADTPRASTPGAWTLDRLPAGAEALFSFRLATPREEPSWCTAELVRASPPDPDALLEGPSRQHLALLMIRRPPPSGRRFVADLALKASAPLPHHPTSDDVPVTLELTNTGPSGTSKVTIGIQGVKGFLVAPPAGDGTYDDSTGIWTVGRISPARRAVLTLPLRVSSSDSLTVMAEILSSSVPDPDSRPGNGDPEEDDQAEVLLGPAMGKRPPLQPAWHPWERRLSLGPVYPNPSSGTVTIPFTLPSGAPVSLRVYDAAGRHMATLWEGTLEAGSHAISWRSPIPSGRYLLRLSTPTAVRSTWLTSVHAR